MATTLTVHAPTSAGITSSTAAFVAAPDTTGFVFRNTLNTIIVIQNTHSAAISATIVTPGTVDGLSVTDRTVSIPASSFVYLNLPGLYNDASGNVSITFASFGTGSAANILALVLTSG